MGFIQLRRTEGLQGPTHTLLSSGYSPGHGCLYSSLPSCARRLRLVKPEVMDTISQLLSVEAAAAKQEEEGCPGSQRWSAAECPVSQHGPLSSHHPRPISKPYSFSACSRVMGKTTQTQKPLRGLDPAAPSASPQPPSLHTDSTFWPPGATSLSPEGLPPSHLQA